MVKIPSIRILVLKVLTAHACVTEPQTQLCFTVLQSSLLWQGDAPASVGSLLPSWLLTQNVFPSLTQAGGWDLLTQSDQLMAMCVEAGTYRTNAI